MTQNPYPPPLPPHAPPGLLFPVVVGGLVAVIVHALGLPFPGLYACMACTCGLSGLPGGLTAAGIAAARDRTVRAGRGFTAGFLAGLLGAAIVAGILLVKGYEVPQEVLDEVRREALDAPDGRQLSEQELEDVMRMVEMFGLASPWIALGGQVLTGALAGMVLAMLVNRRPPAPYYPPNDGGQPHYPPPR